MSCSRKKAWEWISKRWDKFAEKAYRHRTKQQLRFDPDADWEEANLTTTPPTEWGTKCGFNVPPDEDKSPDRHQEYRKLRRK